MALATSSSSTLGLARSHTVAFSGVDVKDVDVQVQISSGLPAFIIVGLPDKAVGESRERARRALGAPGLGLPPKRITVNPARQSPHRLPRAFPADRRDEPLRIRSTVAII